MILVKHKHIVQYDSCIRAEDAVCYKEYKARNRTAYTEISDLCSRGAKHIEPEKLELTDVFNGHFLNQTSVHKPAVKTAQSANYTLAANMKLSMCVTPLRYDSDRKS